MYEFIAIKIVSRSPSAQSDIFTFGNNVTPCALASVRLCACMVFIAMQCKRARPKPSRLACYVSYLTAILSNYHFMSIPQFKDVKFRLMVLK